VIALSAVLVMVAVALLVRGVTVGSGPYLYASIVASAIAALMLVAGVRRMADPVGDDDFDVPTPRDRVPS
jgi:hypothetical protein